MPHTYNQRVFDVPDLSSPLVLLYLRLIAIEIALKNHDATNWTLQHDVVLMTSSFQDAALNALAARAKTCLGVLWCEKRGGGYVRVSAANYPVVRYLRHSSDHAASASSDVELEDAKLAVNDLADELRRRKVL